MDNVKVIFVSNYYNHHQSSFANAMSQLTNGNFFFIENEEMSLERKNMGWGEQDIPLFVKQAYKDEPTRKECINIINSADIVIFENTTRCLVKKRLESGKLTFLYSERYFKSGYEWWKLPIRWFTWRRIFGQYKNHYLLCASAYTAADFALTFNFIGKAYKWGYFPLLYQYSINELMSHKLSVQTSKQKQPIVSILWAGRLIDWKHPEVPIRLAQVLKEKGYSFKMSIIGNGEMEKYLHKLIQDNDLMKCVEIFGAMTPDQVRMYMEKADIYLFTSDFNEGWGAVLNESMNSGCAVVASHAIGSVPYLIKHDVNGLIYQNGDEKDLQKKVEILLNDSNKRKKLGCAAYETITETWNADIAAKRLLKLVEDLNKNGKSSRYTEGPCSKAEFLHNGWYKK